MDAEKWVMNIRPHNFKGFGPTDGGLIWYIGKEIRGEVGCQGFEQGEEVYHLLFCFGRNWTNAGHRLPRLTLSNPV